MAFSYDAKENLFSEVFLLIWWRLNLLFCYKVRGMLPPFHLPFPLPPPNTWTSLACYVFLRACKSIL